MFLSKPTVIEHLFHVDHSYGTFFLNYEIYQINNCHKIMTLYIQGFLFSIKFD